MLAGPLNHKTRSDLHSAVRLDRILNFLDPKTGPHAVASNVVLVVVVVVIFSGFLLSDLRFSNALHVASRPIVVKRFTHIMRIFCIKLPWRIFALGPN